jgi:RNA polymerase sigma factor (sigma-70 family)
LPLDAHDISELYRRHARDLLVYFTRRVYDRDDAIGWMYGIAHHQIGRYFRRGAVERRALAKLGVEVPAMSDAEYDRIVELTGLEQLRGRVRAALDELPLDQRRAIELRIIEERRYNEVADELGITEQVARARVSRGLRTLASKSRALNGGDPLPLDEAVGLD